MYIYLSPVSDIRALPHLPYILPHVKVCRLSARGLAENWGGHLCWFSRIRCLQGLAGWFEGGVTGGTRGNQPMWTLWGNVYTTRNGVGSDIAQEPTGRDLSGHGT